MITCNKILIAFTATIFFSLSALSQSYFAGAGAGTGNTGSSVTGVGTSAISSSNSGFGNCAYGALSLRQNTTGTYNVAAGYSSLTSNINGGSNTAVGSFALNFNTSGGTNTAIGYSTLFNNSSGTNNIGVGVNALYGNTTGSYNVAVGRDALFSNTIGVENTAGGAFSLRSNTTGVRNAAFGDSALFANTTGSFNSSVGAYSLRNNATGLNNTAMGFKSLYRNSGGSDNTACGYMALGNNTAGSNTAVGTFAMAGNSTGFANTAVGANALQGNGTGIGSTAIGEGALYALNGSYNVAIGISAGVQSDIGPDITTGDSLTLVGATSRTSTNGIKNSIALGYHAIVDASNKAIIGNTAVTSIGGQVGWTTFSDRRLKTNINKSKLGLDFILALNPVTYSYKAEGQKGITYTGLIAQEVDEAAKKSGAEFSGVDKNGQYWGIRYGELTVPLIKATQEMKSLIEELQAEVAELKKERGIVEKAASSILYQNVPNPFNQSTTIRYQLSFTDNNAMIIIRNISGVLVKQINLSTQTKGAVTISAGELPSGTYTYSLFTSGNLVDTKLMVIAK